jgi:heat shock protein beta
MQVIYLTDAIDEYLTQNLTEYDDKKFQNASKDDLNIGSKDEKAKFKELTKWWKDLLVNENVESVKVPFSTLPYDGVFSEHKHL